MEAHGMLAKEPLVQVLLETSDSQRVSRVSPCTSSALTEGSSVVRQTSNSAVAGLPTETAPPPSGSGTRTLSKFSAREHSALRIEQSGEVAREHQHLGLSCTLAALPGVAADTTASQAGP